jgi:hypothetical protein
MIETQSLWSSRVGEYQVWHTLRAEDHGIAGLSDLTTPSYFSETENPPLRRRKYLGFELSNPAIVIWFWVTPSGRVSRAIRAAASQQST